MKLIANNFTGIYDCGTRYRVLVLQEENDNEKYLFAQLETLTNGAWRYEKNVAVTINAEYKYALQSLIEKAEKAFELKLFKEEKELKVVA